MSGFNHSVKVPTQYKKVASVLEKALENRQKSIKNLIYDEKHARVPSMHAVLKQYSDNRGAIDSAIESTKILEENPRLKPALCKVLITELIYGRKDLRGESKPVQTVREYRERLVKALGGDDLSADFVVEKKTGSKPRYVRVNTNLLSVDKAHALLVKGGFHKKELPPIESYDDFLKAIKELDELEYMIDMHIDGLFIFHAKKKQYWALHQYVKEKKFILQDKGTCLVAELLQPPPGSTVLDMCAAPGMKTIHTCNVMKNQGTIYAIEQSTDRYKTLCNMTKSAGCEIVRPINKDSLSLTAEEVPGVEYILVDPSCSGSGIQNRLSFMSEEKDPERLKKLGGMQIKMLSHAMTAFPDVKRIAYSTCSLYEEENEQTVRKCLILNPNFKLLSGKKALRNKWRNVGSSEYKKIGKNCLYTLPEDDLADGFFVAIFEKCNNNEVEQE